MKQIYFLLWLCSSLAFGQSQNQKTKLINHAVTQGCGWADATYKHLARVLPEHAEQRVALRVLGPETARVLYVYSDKSWFATLEFLSEKDTGQDISCVIAKGDGNHIQDSFDIEVTEYPAWKWGGLPSENWPPSKP